MLLQIMATLGLFGYIIELNMEKNNIFDLYDQLKSILPIMKWVSLVELAINVGFFSWTCFTIYQIWFDLRPSTYKDVSTLMFICIINLFIEYQRRKRFK